MHDWSFSGEYGIVTFVKGSACSAFGEAPRSSLLMGEGSCRHARYFETGSEK